MRAWLMEHYQGVDQLRLAEVPAPQPGAGEVVLKVLFAALNPADAFLAQGLYPARPPLPHVLGRDGVGVVTTMGPDVQYPRIGDCVGVLRCDVGVTRWGTLAEEVAVPADSVASIPDGWSPEEMAGAPLVFLTAWQALTQWTEPPAPPPPGQRLLVTGASGGVGVASVLLGKSMGLPVVALSRSQEKAARLRELGADYVFDPADPNLVKTMIDTLGRHPIDLAVDTVGGPLFPKVIALLSHGGRVSIVGRSGGTVPQFNTATLLFHRIRLGGVSVGDYGPQEARTIWEDIVRRLRSLGRKPVVDSIVPFEEVKQGFARLAQGPLGKVLVRMTQSL
ncbi:quinone oxidoreductase family protein [Candidatus Nitrospira inopinata]|jgi:NADPH2:quinone reductase|uniref:Oxidoreductase, zinc-binding dehydrogenase family n=1 Tax=Candidatus Nitrospira inopinata TaxID=1715989 RepID=A0A0S4KZE7_9BACT|nr:zinc-binding dehydrogenase [Candidatus Nitrospira inopinata]CUQ67835.1 Oxidoreductase, zinc-binding dehydrogenase family [Candidatus Nitrospira inopinata]